jgi:hypothetical protein
VGFDPLLLAHLDSRAPTARKDSAYRSGRLPDWFKKKNPATGSVTTYRRFNKPSYGPLGDSLEDLK